MTEHFESFRAKVIVGIQSQVACACSQIKKPAANNGINSLFSVSTHGFLALLTILFITGSHLMSFEDALLRLGSYIIKIMLTYTCKIQENQST